MLRVKGQDGFCPVGLVLVDADDVDPEDLPLRTFLNGEEVQHGHTGSDPMFSFAYQIADLAMLITLEPGRVLLAGTSANSRPVDPGTTVAVDVNGIGRLENRIVESAYSPAEFSAQPKVTAQTLHLALKKPEEVAERDLSSPASGGPGEKR